MTYDNVQCDFVPAWDSERHFVVQSQDPRTTVHWYVVVEVIDKEGTTNGLPCPLRQFPEILASRISAMWFLLFHLLTSRWIWVSWSQGHGWIPASMISSREGSWTRESRHFHSFFCCKDFMPVKTADSRHAGWARARRTGSECNWQSGKVQFHQTPKHSACYL